MYLSRNCRSLLLVRTGEFDKLDHALRKDGIDILVQIGRQYDGAWLLIWALYQIGNFDVGVTIRSVFDSRSLAEYTVGFVEEQNACARGGAVGTGLRFIAVSLTNLYTTVIGAMTLQQPRPDVWWAGTDSPNLQVATQRFSLCRQRQRIPVST